MDEHGQSACDTVGATRPKSHLAWQIWCHWNCTGMVAFVPYELFAVCAPQRRDVWEIWPSSWGTAGILPCVSTIQLLHQLVVRHHEVPLTRGTLLRGQYAIISVVPPRCIFEHWGGSCIAELNAWKTADKLLFNGSKTEILLVGTRQQLLKVVIDAFTISSCHRSPASSWRDLDVWFDSELTMSTHVDKRFSTAYFYLYIIKRIRKYMSHETCVKIVCAFYTSRIDCNG